MQTGQQLAPQMMDAAMQQQQQQPQGNE